MAPINNPACARQKRVVLAQLPPVLAKCVFTHPDDSAAGKSEFAKELHELGYDIAAIN